MTCFNMFVIIAGVILGTTIVTSRNINSDTLNCDYEVEKLYGEYARCTPYRFQMPAIQFYISKYRGRTMNATEFSRSILEYCGTLKNMTSCFVAKTTTVNHDCLDSGLVQNKLNSGRITAKAAEVLCSESVIYEIADDKGFNCLDISLLDRCFNKHQSPQNVDGAFEDKNRCETVNNLLTCSNELFDQCSNDGHFKGYLAQWFNGLIQDFSC